MRMLFRLAFLAAISWSAGCSKPRAVKAAATAAAPANTMNPGDFIARPGSLSYSSGTNSVHLNLSRHGDRVAWNFLHLGSDSRTYGSGMILASPDLGTWFLYMEDAATFWMYDGGSVLRYHSMEHSGPKSGSVIREGKLDHPDRRPPDEVILKLPPAQQKLFPPVTAPTARPSI